VIELLVDRRGTFFNFLPFLILVNGACSFNLAVELLLRFKTLFALGLSMAIENKITFSEENFVAMEAKRNIMTL
jgi:hypothetical protein